MHRTIQHPQEFLWGWRSAGRTQCAMLQIGESSAWRGQQQCRRDLPERIPNERGACTAPTVGEVVSLESSLRAAGALHDSLTCNQARAQNPLLSLCREHSQKSLWMQMGGQRSRETCDFEGGYPDQEHFLWMETNCFSHLFPPILHYSFFFPLIAISKQFKVKEMKDRFLPC